MNMLTKDDHRFIVNHTQHAAVSCLHIWQLYCLHFGDVQLGPKLMHV